MPTRCVAAACSNTHRDGVSLFRFPRDPCVREKWTKQVQRTRAQWKPTKNSVLCNQHFEEDCFEPGTDIARQFEIGQREHAATKTGEECYDLVFPKYKKGGCVELKVKVAPTYSELITPMKLLIGDVTVFYTSHCTDYIDDLLTEVINQCVVGGSSVQSSRIPKSLCSEYHRPTKASAILCHRSRFAKN